MHVLTFRGQPPPVLSGLRSIHLKDRHTTIFNISFERTCEMWPVLGRAYSARPTGFHCQVRVRCQGTSGAKKISTVVPSATKSLATARGSGDKQCKRGRGKILSCEVWTEAPKLKSAHERCARDRYMPRATSTSCCVACKKQKIQFCMVHGIPCKTTSSTY